MNAGKEDAAIIGRDIYNEKIRDTLKPEDKGKMVVIDVKTGDYEIARRQADARQLLVERRPGAITHTERIGYQTAHKLGLNSWTKTND